ncbi:MAG: peroxiredoxin [Planctomycetaceae bacterium]|nr:MAG: peroxiredoxin [Planctomycetaceae bacterium]
MSQHRAWIEWKRGEAVFSDGKYSRGHVWKFDGGITVPASSAPEAIRPPLSVVEAVDPEEAVVAALASCHMLWFLALARKQGFIVEQYQDEPVGELGKNAEGKTALLTITLKPLACFAGDNVPSLEQLHALHHEAHELCYVANSLKTEVRVEPRLQP